MPSCYKQGADEGNALHCGLPVSDLHQMHPYCFKRHATARCFMGLAAALLRYDTSRMCPLMLELTFNHCGAQVLEQEAAAQNGLEHPVSEAEQDGYELAHQVARRDDGAQASTSGRSAEPEGEVLLELHNVHKAFGSKRILQVCQQKTRHSKGFQEPSQLAVAAHFLLLDIVLIQGTML